MNTSRIIYQILSIKFRNSERKVYCYLVNIRETRFGFRQKELYLYGRRAEGRKHWRLYCLFSMQKAKTIGRKEKTEAGSVFSNGCDIFSIVGSEIAEEAENYNKT